MDNDENISEIAYIYHCPYPIYTQYIPLSLPYYTRTTGTKVCHQGKPSVLGSHGGGRFKIFNSGFMMQL